MIKEQKTKEEQRCCDCSLKLNDCSIWIDKAEKNLNNWDKNRAAMFCLKFTKEKTDESI